MLELFKLVFEINFFVFPLSAAWLSYRKLRGKTAGRYFRLMVWSAIMLVLSWIGIFLNESPENRYKTLTNIEQALGFDELETKD